MFHHSHRWLALGAVAASLFIGPAAFSKDKSDAQGAADAPEKVAPKVAKESKEAKPDAVAPAAADIERQIAVLQKEMELMKQIAALQKQLAQLQAGSSGAEKPQAPLKEAKASGPKDQPVFPEPLKATKATKGSPTKEGDDDSTPRKKSKRDD